MGKWVASFILLLHVCLSGRNALARDDENFFKNFFLEESIDEAQCDQMQLEVAAMDSAMTLDSFPRLNGKWVSQECEVRPGPEFLLRSYSFTKNNSFRLLQHFYEDDSCILPLYTVVARGELILKEPSWVTPGGIECEYILTRVTVIPHTTEVGYLTIKPSGFAVDAKHILMKWSFQAEERWYWVLKISENTVTCPGFKISRLFKEKKVNGQLTRIHELLLKGIVTDKLSKEIKHKCTDILNKAWKPHREYTIYYSKSPEKFSENQRRRKKHRRYKGKKIHRDIDCLSAIGVEFNELMLIRTQTRLMEKKNRELLLGDVHSRQEARFTHKPTAFQVPLIKIDQAQNCVNCHLIFKGTERAPPHLLSKPQLPPLPHGQWISQRCEVRPFGMFLIRKLSFDSRDRTWVGEYKFHTDPFCTEPAFAISASGRYLLGPIKSKEKLIRKRKTGTNFDFIIEDASLTLFDPTLRDTFNTETNCGVGPWFVGVPKELSPTSGCSVLGIELPATEYELIKLEIDNKGTPLLFMGLPDTENKKRTHKDRPTSYQAPLAQCSVFPQKNTVSNHLEPIYYARTAPRSSATSQPRTLWFIFGLVTILRFLYFCTFH